MGAWRALRHRLEETKPEGVPLLYVGRTVAGEPERGLSDRRTCASRTGSSALALGL